MGSKQVVSMPYQKKRLNPTADHFRSAISNGRQIFKDVDHRSSWMRRLRDLILDQTNDLGGEEHVSEAEKLLVRRAAMLTLQLEFLEQSWADDYEGRAPPSSLENYQRNTNTLRRTLEVLASGSVRPQHDGVFAKDVTGHAKAVLEGIRNDGADA